MSINPNPTPSPAPLDIQSQPRSPRREGTTYTSAGESDYPLLGLSRSSHEILTRPYPVPSSPTTPRGTGGWIYGKATSYASPAGNALRNSSSSRSPLVAKREGEVLKYSEFLPKLMEERRRLETELKLLTTHHHSLKKRRRKIQRLTKERVIKIQQIKSTQTTSLPSEPPQTDRSPKGTKRQVKIVAPRETHGVLAMLGISTASLSIKDRSLGSSATKKERRNNKGEVDASKSAGGIARTMAAGLLSKASSAPGGVNSVDTGKKQGPRATGAISLAGGNTEATSTNSVASMPSSDGSIIALVPTGPTIFRGGREEGEGRRFFGSNKYRKYEMDVMKDDGFADLFSKFQASGISGGDDEEDGSESTPSPLKGSAEGEGEATSKDRLQVGTNEESGEEKANESTEPTPEGSESERERKGCEEAGEDSVAGSLLGSFIVMKRDYQRRLSEFDEKIKCKSDNANEKIAELQAMLNDLRREQAELKARVQTSQDDAQLLESFSVGVSLFDKKKEDENTTAGKDDKQRTKQIRRKKEHSGRVSTKAATKEDKKEDVLEVNEPEHMAIAKTSALAEYGSESLELVTTCSMSSVAEYGAANAVGEEEDEETKLCKTVRKKRNSSRKNKTERKKSATDGEAAGNASDSKDNDEEGSTRTNAPSGERSKGRRKKRKDKTNKGREILLKAYHEIAYEELQFDPTPLGNGAFGVVYKALWRGTPVAVKKLMVMQFTEAEVYNFKREASIMEKYSNHPNIVKFCGISTKFPHYCIVTEYMERGCVRDALAQNPNLPWKTIVGMALDAAAGILHLHAEHIVHRDLALRNMLVGQDWRVRMADFGLARMMPKDTYAKTRGNIGAVRWLAPEVITKSVYSEKSDSYAFGIVMWELLARGEEPFADKTNIMEVALGIINEGLRPTIPKGTPEEYERLMVDCWSKNIDDRPDFVQIHKRLKAYHATLT